MTGRSDTENRLTLRSFKGSSLVGIAHPLGTDRPYGTDRPLGTGCPSIGVSRPS